MSTPQELLNQRMTRVLKAIALEKPDRTPVIAWADAFCANYLGVKLSEYCASPFVAADTHLRFFKEFSDFDMTEVDFTPPPLVSMGFMSKMKLPGKDLPEDANWIVEEKERITPEDYDKILEVGWDDFFSDFIVNELQIPEDYLGMVFGAAAEYDPKFYEAGIPIYTLAMSPGIPLEALAGGRMMANFIKDLYRIPDKVEAVLDVIIESYVNQLRGVVETMPQKPFSIFIGISRGAPEFLSPKLWRRFVEPYMNKIVETVLDLGCYANLHFDSTWDRELESLKHFPKNKCILACDHSTDIYKIKEVLGDIMAIKGDVPSPMLAFGTPDEVYDYCTKLIRDMGSGFILAPACTLPANAKVENVKAMLAAATGK
jgi:uroporphyrinogen-III decarboxylase